MYTYQEKTEFVWYQSKYLLKKVNRKFKKKLHIQDSVVTSLYGHEFVDLETVQGRIYQLILSDEPFMVGRLGGVECLNVLEAIKVDMGLKQHMSEKIMKKAQMNAGFFPPTEEAIRMFSQLIEDSIEQIDVLGSMPKNNEEYLLRKHLPYTAMVTEIGNLESYYFSKPWSKALEGKKVLVIYPFKDSIISQYKKREFLFSNKDVLPAFELHVIKAVQSIAGTETEFDNWFSALDYMYDEAMKVDFDVAIIGCGAYGFPLAAKLKKAGKQAIHLGGATQILFGIWGSRWESIEPVRKLKNEYWVRPLKDETPSGAKKVENACYW